MKYVLSVLAVCSLFLLFLLTFGTANSPILIRYFWLFVLLDIALSICSIVIILVQIKNLVYQYRIRRFGTRLKMRLVILVTVVSFFPGVVIYLVSIGFVTHSIESWFDVHVDKALESGVKLGRDILNTMLYNLTAAARDAAVSIENASPSSFRMSRSLLMLKDSAQLDDVFIVDLHGRVLSYVSDHSLSLQPSSVPTKSQLLEAERVGSLSIVKIDAKSNRYGLLVVRPLMNSGMLPRKLFLVVQKSIPESLSHSLVSVEDVNRDYATLAFSRKNLKKLYILSLTLVLLLILLFAVLAAIYYSDLLAAPIFMLFEGTEAVSHGDFSPRQFSGGTDELSLLTRLFHQMTCQLRDTQQLAREKSIEIERERSYLSNILKTLTTGVITFDAQFCIKAINRSAKEILDDDCHDLLDVTLSSWPRLREISDVILNSFAMTQSTWRRQINYTSDLSNKSLLMRGTYFSHDEEGGYIVVFDDLTPLVHAQKMMVWGEIAQRLAHEIKNPLMPIQLSAERLHVKLADKLFGDDRLMLERSTHLIVRQVVAMKDLINDFRDLTQLPLPHVLPIKIAGLIAEVSFLYEQDDFKIHLELDDRDVDVLADEKQVRQVLHNLLRNALDAVSNEEDPSVGIRLFYDNSMAVIIVSDNGSGFPIHIIKKAFEPYVTSKPRGTGLGLAIVKKIVDEHDGTIEVRNGVKGASVIIALPCIKY
ncbi:MULTISPECIES: sensor histidine kinase [Candidatus Ichthyocystis]|uniref:histidine kinase n=1 Tax=Candidatus Ichthyocystis hellenicum TaxID=1561003 RepID=A0A0S4M1K4_9BURK|nr:MULTISPECIES: ATP-binding protein [Ichthyocystis]CUT17163.1 putative histidine kinase [Candidatus Ichthyocystis hellenicum]